MISIIVPVYNNEEYLRDCIGSILEQTYKDIEVILVDDGSTDESGVICDSYASSCENVKVIHKKNGGVSSARNAGLEIASGDYIGFVDSDDLIAPDMYEKLYWAFVSSDIIASICLFTRFVEDSEVDNNPQRNELTDPNIYLISVERFFLDQLDNKRTVAVWSALFKREVFDKLRFREGYIQEDFLFSYDFYKLYADTSLKLSSSLSSLYFYRLRFEGDICSRPDFYLSSLDNFIQIMNETKEMHPELVPHLSKNFLSCYFRQIDAFGMWYFMPSCRKKYRSILKTVPFSAYLDRPHFGTVGIFKLLVNRLFA